MGQIDPGSGPSMMDGLGPGSDQMSESFEVCKNGGATGNRHFQRALSQKTHLIAIINL